MRVVETRTDGKGPQVTASFTTNRSENLTPLIVSPMIAEKKGSSVTLAWVTPTIPGNLQLGNYEIVYAHETANKKTVLFTGSSNQFFTLTELIPCANYWFAVRATFKDMSGTTESQLTAPYSNRLETNIFASTPAPVDSITASFVNRNSLTAVIEDWAIRPSCGSYKYLTTLINPEDGQQLNKYLTREKCWSQIC
ncbi:hypothetical protein Ciccas_013940 [Cichlidogyrus casuarinus]|uniref:Fibronectin type-III domain-containing protein n=1 Tax=Cichlidogyrus casuarinus TaxID=1844966 RepID=A0ABD2PKG9_9PLAT